MPPEEDALLELVINPVKQCYSNFHTSFACISYKNVLHDKAFVLENC